MIFVTVRFCWGHGRGPARGVDRANRYRFEVSVKKKNDLQTKCRHQAAFYIGGEDHYEAFVCNMCDGVFVENLKTVVNERFKIEIDVDQTKDLDTSQSNGGLFKQLISTGAWQRLFR